MTEDSIIYYNASIARCHRDQLEEPRTREFGSNTFLYVVQWYLDGNMFVEFYASVSLSLVGCEGGKM